MKQLLTDYFLVLILSLAVLPACQHRSEQMAEVEESNLLFGYNLLN